MVKCLGLMSLSVFVCVCVCEMLSPVISSTVRRCEFVTQLKRWTWRLNGSNTAQERVLEQT